ncbi:MAG: redoxin domain-containing protein [Acidobacteriota bacterium]|nr:MAG: redoxin domain-containing protein [Acidobacteriota bacterium]
MSRSNDRGVGKALWRAVSAGALAAVLVSGAVCSTGQSSSEPIAIGDEAPDFSLQGTDGNTYRLSDSRGSEPVLLIFYRGVW